MVSARLSCSRQWSILSACRASLWDLECLDLDDDDDDLEFLVNSTSSFIWRLAWYVISFAISPVSVVASKLNMPQKLLLSLASSFHSSDVFSLRTCRARTLFCLYCWLWYWCCMVGMRVLIFVLFVVVSIDTSGDLPFKGKAKASIMWSCLVSITDNSCSVVSALRWCRHVIFIFMFNGTGRCSYASKSAASTTLFTS